MSSLLKSMSSSGIVAWVSRDILRLSILGYVQASALLVSAVGSLWFAVRGIVPAWIPLLSMASVFGLVTQSLAFAKRFENDLRGTLRDRFALGPDAERSPKAVPPSILLDVDKGVQDLADFLDLRFGRRLPLTRYSGDVANRALSDVGLFGSSFNKKSLDGKPEDGALLAHYVAYLLAELIERTEIIESGASNQEAFDAAFRSATDLASSALVWQAMLRDLHNEARARETQPDGSPDEPRP